MDFDFSDDFTSSLKVSPLQKLRQEWTLRTCLSPPGPRPQELFPSVTQESMVDGPPPRNEGVLEPPREDAFVAARASMRRVEYEKLEMWISSGGAVEDYAPWFREMLMDHDDAALISALRAVAAHYRRCAQQLALGDSEAAPVPVCWLTALAERLQTCEAKVAHEAADLVAACLAAEKTGSPDISQHQAFFECFGALAKGKVHLLAACQEVLQPEDWQEMLQRVRLGPTEQLPREFWRRLPVELQTLAQCQEPEPVAMNLSPMRLALPSGSPSTPSAWSGKSTWRQRVRYLEHLAERGGEVQNLWPQLVLQVEDDHPAVSAAALHCLANVAPQMAPPADHLLLRLATALRHRLREPRSRLRSAALEFLQSLGSAVLVAQTFQVSKERARKAVLEARNDGSTNGPVGLEALMTEAFPPGGLHSTPSPDRGRWLASAAVSPQKLTPLTPHTVTPSTGNAHTPETEEKPSTPRKVLKLEPELQGSVCLLPSESTLLSFEATPQRQGVFEAREEQTREDAACEVRSEALRLPMDQSEVASPLSSPLPSRTHPDEGQAAADHAELTWSFQKIHMITLELSRPGADEVEQWGKLTQLLSRGSLQGPLRRFLRRWLQRQRRKAAAKENLAPSDKSTSSVRLDDYASLRELCSDENLPGAFPQSVLSHLRRTLLSPTPGGAHLVQAAVQALEKCAQLCGAALRGAWPRFAAPLLRLCAAAARRPLRRQVGAALLRGAGGWRNAWRWMQAAAGTDQALVVESLHVVAMLEDLPPYELSSEVVQDILAVACPYLEASGSRSTTLASQRCVQTLQKQLGVRRLREELAHVAPNLQLDAVLPGKTLSAPPKEAARPRRRGPPATEATQPAARSFEQLAGSAPGKVRQSELEILEAQLLDVSTLRNGDLPWPHGELRRQWQDLSTRYASPQLVKLFLAAITCAWRLCMDASEEAAASCLRAAQEVLLAARSSSDEVLSQVDAVSLFRCLLQILMQLETLSSTDALRRWTTPILLEVPPFLARAMDVLEVGKQLIAWLELALELVDQRSSVHGEEKVLSAAKRTWALRFCARAAERCGIPVEGHERLAWEALAKLTQLTQVTAAGGNEWPDILQALSLKIAELYPSQAQDLAKLTGSSA